MVFIESKAFNSRVRDLLSDEELVDFQSELVASPKKGDVVRGTGGLRKVRVAQQARGKGKRGGVRVLYLHLEDRDHIHLLLAYGKDERDDLTTEQKSVLKKLVARIKRT